MPESPDFDAIARASITRWGFDEEEPLQRSLMIEDFAEQLRQVWNARGAVDIATVEAELSTMMGWTAAGPYVKNLDRALRTLDR
jgi:hypothetical protein